MYTSCFGTDWSFCHWSNLIHRSIWLIVHSEMAKMIFDFFYFYHNITTSLDMFWRLVGTFVLFTRLNFPRVGETTMFSFESGLRSASFLCILCKNLPQQQQITAHPAHHIFDFRVIYCQIRKFILFHLCCLFSSFSFRFVVQVVQSKSFNIGFASGCPWQIILFCQEKKAAYCAYWDKGPLPVTLCCLHGFPKANTRNQHRPLRQQQPPSSLSWWLWRCWLSGDTETIILTCAFYTTQLFNLCWLVFSSNSVNWPPESEWPSSSLRCVQQRVQPYLWELWDAF